MTYKNIQEHILTRKKMNRYDCPDRTLQHEPQLFQEAKYDNCRKCGGHHEIVNLEYELCQGCADEEYFDKD